MYVNTQQLGSLGIAPAAIPVAAAVLKNLNLFKMFGGKLIHGLKRHEFESRHSDHKWFNALWVGGYWTGKGASEIPAGLSVQDYFVGRFGIGPLIPSDQRLARARQRGIPDSSWKLSSVPLDMVWPSDIAVFRKHEIERVLPPGYSWDSVKRKVIRPTAVFPAVPTIAPAPPVAAAQAVPAVGLPDLLRSPALLIGLGLVGFLVMRTMMRPERS